MINLSINNLMRVKLIYIGKNRDENLEKLVNKYKKRINYYLNFDIIQIKSKILSPEKSLIQSHEAELLFKNIDEDENIVLLDEKGENYTTNDFVIFFNESILNRNKSLIFVIAGAYGFSEKIKMKFKKSISLSNMTLTHDMARLILVEQIYRSLTIIKNIPYHNR